MTRRRLAVALVGVIVFTVATPRLSGAQCTPQERIELNKAGYSRVEVDNICGRPTQQQAPLPSPQQRQQQQQFPPPPQLAAVCQTAWGMCPMVTPLPVGASCACYYPSGVFPGVAR
jgi:hypothetical protein